MIKWAFSSLLFFFPLSLCGPSYFLTSEYEKSQIAFREMTEFNPKLSQGNDLAINEQCSTRPDLKELLQVLSRKIFC